MSVLQMKVKPDNLVGSAPLQNLNTLEQLLIKIMNRPEHLPGMGTFSGPSGFGKSTAAAYVTSQHNAAYIECRSIWAKKSFLEALTRQLGLEAKSTMPAMADSISEELALSQRPVIIDEFDHCVLKEGFVELVRDIYEQSKCPIILIGEEGLPHKLRKWERFDGRILSRAQAQPANLVDARALNRHYNPEILIEDDLLNKLLDEARGSVRRIVTNLHEFFIFGESEGINRISVDDWGNRPFIKSSAPPARTF